MSQALRVRRSQGHKFTRSEGHKVITSQGHKVIRSQVHKVIRSQGLKVTMSQGHKVTKSYGHKVIPQRPPGPCDSSPGASLQPRVCSASRMCSAWNQNHAQGFHTEAGAGEVSRAGWLELGQSNAAANAKQSHNFGPSLLLPMAELCKRSGSSWRQQPGKQ